MSTAETETETIPEAVDIHARNERVMQNQGLVYRIARGFEGRGVEAEDLVQFGNVGLIRAAERFDPARGIHFSTFAVPWIRQYIFGGVSGRRWLHCHPVAVSQGRAAIAHAAAALAETGRRPSLAESVAALHPGDGKVIRARRERIRNAAIAAVAVRVDVPLDLDPAPGPDPSAALVAAEHRELLARALGMLPGHLRLVLACRYGLDGGPPLGPKAAAKRLGITYETAARRERLAIAKLKELLNVPGDES